MDSSVIYSSIAVSSCFCPFLHFSFVFGSNRVEFLSPVVSMMQVDTTLETPSYSQGKDFSEEPATIYATSNVIVVCVPRVEVSIPVTTAPLCPGEANVW